MGVRTLQREADIGNNERLKLLADKERDDSRMHGGNAIRPQQTSEIDPSSTMCPESSMKSEQGNAVASAAQYGAYRITLDYNQKPEMQKDNAIWTNLVGMKPETVDNPCLCIVIYAVNPPLPRGCVA